MQYSKRHVKDYICLKKRAYGPLFFYLCKFFCLYAWHGDPHENIWQMTFCIPREKHNNFGKVYVYLTLCLNVICTICFFLIYFNFIRYLKSDFLRINDMWISIKKNYFQNPTLSEKELSLFGELDEHG